MVKKLGIVLVALAFVLGFTMQVSATVPTCEEEVCETGLDILPGVGYPGSNVIMEVDVNNAPNDVCCFGFDVTYDPYVLDYVGPLGVLDPSDLHICELLTGWSMVGINELGPGVLRIGGFTTENGIQAGKTGCMILLDFHVLVGCEPTVCYIVDIDDLSLAGHIAGWPACHGCLCYGCPHSGDIDLGQELTPKDALYAFRFYLGILPPCEDGVGVPDEDCLTDCQQDHADVCSPVDPGSGITPVDALCIFTAYMNGLAPQDPLPCGVCD